MGKATAKVGGKVIAESDTYETVDGNIYFPPSSVDQSVMTKSSTTTGCPYKGTAHYYTIKADGKELKDAAWYYPEPKPKAMNIKDHVAFYKTKLTITS